MENKLALDQPELSKIGKEKKKEIDTINSSFGSAPVIRYKHIHAQECEGHSIIFIKDSRFNTPKTKNIQIFEVNSRDHIPFKVVNTQVLSSGLLKETDITEDILSKLSPLDSPNWGKNNNGLCAWWTLIFLAFWFHNKKNDDWFLIWKEFMEEVEWIDIHNYEYQSEQTGIDRWGKLYNKMVEFIDEIKKILSHYPISQSKKFAERSFG